MPKVLFVNEHREVEVESGRLISDIADELGIGVCREEFTGTGIGDYTCWVDGGVSPLTFSEKWLKGCKGQRRQANKVRVLGDVKVWTQQGMAYRLRAPRPVSPPPNPSDDPTAERFDHEQNPAGTAWNPYGHPKAVGAGKREPPKMEPPKKKDKPDPVAKKGAVAGAAAAAGAALDKHDVRKTIEETPEAKAAAEAAKDVVDEADEQQEA